MYAAYVRILAKKEKGREGGELFLIGLKYKLFGLAILTFCTLDHFTFTFAFEIVAIKTKNTPTIHSIITFDQIEFNCV